MIAVNILDLTKDKILADFLIAPIIQNKTIVHAEQGKLDGGAVILDCPDEQGRAIIEIVRKKYSKNLFRFYESKTGKNWKRI